MFEEFDARTQTRVVRDADGIARVLSHQDDYLATKARTPRAAASEYLSRYGRLFGVRQQHLKNLLKPPEHDLTAAGVEYRLLPEKAQFDLTTVPFHQTYFGLPIWEAGLSVTMKHEPLRVIGARSTLHPEPRVKRPSTTQLAKAKTLDVETLAGHLGLAGRANRSAPLKINSHRFMIYQHDAARLRHATAQSHKRGSAFYSGAPSLPLPPVDSAIRDGAHYVVRAVYFGFDFPPIRPLHWVALIEVETASVLLLRPFVENVTGLVFPADPATLGGPAANAGTAALNRWRNSVTLPGLAAPVKGLQALHGNHVRVTDVIKPFIAPPTKPAGESFAFNARSNDFAAVNAYYNCDRVFRLVEDLGFPVDSYFPNTKFPTRVDHRGHYSKTKPVGIEINAHCAGDAGGTGISYTTFSLADTRNRKQPIGIACDWRIVLHELLGHGVLYNHIGGALFKFAHSAGDSFAAIINDPGTKARDRYATFPWLTQLPKDEQRRHDRKLAEGWGWSDKIALHPFDNALDPRGYSNEQILSSTMFRFYRCDRRRCRQYCRQTLCGTHDVPPSTCRHPNVHRGDQPNGCRTFRHGADEGRLCADWPAAGISGGAYHKVIRWAFEKQGLYQRAGTRKPNNKVGAPPPVDVYIEDGRHGEYQHQSDYSNCRAIWNRRQRDRGTDHETPIAGVTNYAYVKIKNRGSKTATKVVVRAFYWRPISRARLPEGLATHEDGEARGGERAAEFIRRNPGWSVRLGPHARRAQLHAHGGFGRRRCQQYRQSHRPRL